MIFDHATFSLSGNLVGNILILPDQSFEFGHPAHNSDLRAALRVSAPPRHLLGPAPLATLVRMRAILENRMRAPHRLRTHLAPHSGRQTSRELVVKRNVEIF